MSRYVCVVLIMKYSVQLCTGHIDINRILHHLCNLARCKY